MLACRPLLALTALTPALALACSGDAQPRDDAGSQGSTLTLGGGGDEAGDGTDEDDDSLDAEETGPKLDSMMEEGEDEADTNNECAAVSETAQNELAPVDIIFAIDTSGSMSDEKDFVQNNMNTFSTQIFLANIDHHVVMIAGESPDGPCINVPLGTGNCPDDNNPPEYLHVFQEVASTNALELLISTYPDWASSIRSNSVKHVVVVSDDDSAMDAASFDAAFKALDPSFANYYFHAIVAYENPNPIECWSGTAQCCSGLLPLSADVGEVYLDLVALTGGVSGDLCEQEFGPVFTQIAQSVQTTTPLSCEWAIPTPPEGESFDAGKVNIELELDGVPESVYYVGSADDCAGGDGWYYYPDADSPETIRICPATCERVQSATDAQVDILFGCETIPIG
ncbi:VWA domain-containing protein [Pseudenhygromyxa sp. WMMC2535]|uniref:vWA domain-containing protein n=1 Tax=Pseudenhygromyxa sp. WMMC2535 TaxID=2712867 RepID=UPI001554719C|nr:vWA domain-containing protein [Pseudenhygromyxa sp. WMMC2535]NVB42938.1 VWA domain-containing protein [Pseudenhygromyxa sp. WMMC2535]